MCLYRVIMECTYSETYDIPHSKKRRLHGSERTRALITMLDAHVNPSVFQRNEATRFNLYFKHVFTVSFNWPNFYFYIFEKKIKNNNNSHLNLQMFESFTKCY